MDQYPSTSACVPQVSPSFQHSRNRILHGFRKTLASSVRTMAASYSEQCPSRAVPTSSTLPA